MPLRPAKTYLLPALGVSFILLVLATFAQASHIAIFYQSCFALLLVSAVVSFILIVISTGSALWDIIQGKDAA